MCGDVPDLSQALAYRVPGGLWGAPAPAPVCAAAVAAAVACPVMFLTEYCSFVGWKKQNAVDRTELARAPVCHDRTRCQGREIGFVRASGMLLGSLVGRRERAASTVSYFGPLHPSRTARSGFRRHHWDWNLDVFEFESVTRRPWARARARARKAWL